MVEPTSEDVDPSQKQVPVKELALVFLKLGTIAFGGPAAHLALMRQEFVERKRWLTDAEFLDLIGASNIIPGPSSTEVAIYIGLRKGGWIGLVLAGVCFIVPAALIVSAIASVYVRFGHLPQAQGILYGVKPVIIAVVVQALWLLGRMAIKTRLLFAVGLLATILGFLGFPPLALIFTAGGLLGLKGCAAEARPRRSRALGALALGIAILLTLPLAATLLEPTVSSAGHLYTLFLVFIKIGTVVYGSGYVLLAFLKTDLVTRLHWLTSAQLLDAVAVGQFTPGPVFTTATFIGYLVAGPMGALVATTSIFLPSFILVALSGKMVSRLRQSPTSAGFLDGVNVAALALMVVVTWQLARASVVDGLTIILTLGSALLLFRWRVNSAWLVLGGAATGCLSVYLSH